MLTKKEKHRLIVTRTPELTDVIENWPWCIYGTVDGRIWAIVDEWHHEYFNQWKWSYTKNSCGKLYIRRTIRRDKRQTSLLLHRAIMEKTGTPQPTPEHKIVDHKNGNSLDCREDNLRWATVSMNNLNRLKSVARGFRMEDDS